MVARGKYCAYLVLLFTVTALLQDGQANTVKENGPTLKSLEDLVKKSNKVVLRKMKKGFKDLWREFHLQNTMRQDLEEKLEKCLAGTPQPESGHMKTTSAPTTSRRMTTTVVEASCPVGFSEFEDHCYMFEVAKLSWDQARGACQDQGAYLVAVNTQAEQDYIADQIKMYYQSESYWMGMSLVAGKKIWADGTKVNYTRWTGGEPNCMQSHGCKVLITPSLDFRWEDAGRVHKNFYICEMDKRGQGHETAVQSTISSVVMTTASCSVGFSEFEDHCYMFEVAKLSWDQARGACQDQGAYLVAVNTQAEQDYIADQIKMYYQSESYWMGMSLVAGKKIWADGTKVNYTRWTGGEPNCMQSHGCKVLITPSLDFRWEDAGRVHKNFYICEMDKRGQGHETAVQSTISSVVMTTASCSVGFSEFEDHCYMFEVAKLSWDQAREACQDQGAYLVAVNTQAEQDYLVDQITTYYQSESYWMGMSLVAGKKIWADGTKVNYTRWTGGEPNCMQSHGCKVLITPSLDFRWEDAGRVHKNFYICEKDKMGLRVSHP